MAHTQLEIANGLFARKLYDLAAPEYEKYLGIYLDARDRPTALFRLGESYRQLKNRAGAKDAYQSLLLSYTSSEFVAPAAYRLAEYYLEDENYSSALALFDKAAAKSDDPSVVTAARFHAGRTLEALHRKSDARTRYESVVAADKGDNPYRDAARLSLAKLLLDARRNDDAVAQFDALSKDAAKPELRAEAKVRGAMMRVDLGKLDEAARGLEEALEMPELGNWRQAAQMGLMRIRFEQQKFEDVVRMWETKKESLPQELHPEALLLTGNALRQLGRHEEARQIYASLIEQFPKSGPAGEARYNQLISLYSANDPGLAEAVDAFVATNPASDRKAQAQLLKAEALFRAKEYAAAGPAYQAVEIRDLPEKLRQESQFKLAWSVMEAGEHTRAAQAFDDFLKAYPASNLAPTALAQRALARQRAREFKQALADFDELLQRYPEAKERELALQQKALILGQQQENQAMTETFERLLKEFPESAAAGQAYYWIGWSAFEKKAYKKAVEAFVEARKRGKEEFFERATLRIMLAHFYLSDRDAVAGEVDLFNSEKTSGKVPAEILRWLGGEYLEAGKHEEAARYLSQLIGREDERTPVDYLNLGRAQLELGKCEDARGLIAKYLEVTSEPLPRAMGLLVLGRAELCVKEFDLARKTADEALSLQPEGRLNARGRMLIGDIAMARGDVTEAARTYLGLAVVFEDPAITPEAMHKAYDAYVKAGDAAQAAKVLNDLQTRYPEYSHSNGLIQ